MQSVLSLIERVAQERVAGVDHRGVGYGEGAGRARDSPPVGARRVRASTSIAPHSPRALLESELFGHERGAFDRARRAQAGAARAGQWRHVFLDQIGDARREGPRRSSSARWSWDASIGWVARRRCTPTCASWRRPTDDLAQRCGRAERFAAISTTASTRSASDAAAAARARGRTFRCWRALPRRFARSVAPALTEEAMAALRALSVARQRAGAAQRDRARGARWRPAAHSRERPAAWRGARSNGGRATDPARAAGQVERQHIETVLAHAAGTRGGRRTFSASLPRHCTARSASTASPSGNRGVMGSTHQ